MRIYLAVSSKISFYDCENKSGLSKASGTSTRDSNLETSHAFLSLHDGLFHNSELPVTLLVLKQNHSWKKVSYSFYFKLSWCYIMNIFYCVFGYTTYCIF
jgi:hypothetical protein